ncbi:TonB-dependent receptor, partial [Marinovum sp. 1_MG-2023]|nr:TonB-dependent receptor [Marinovum sp. 1_MG-2023]
SQGCFIRSDFAWLTSRARPTDIIVGYASSSSYTLTYSDTQPQGNFAPYLQLTYNEQELDVGYVTCENKSLSVTAKNECQL